MAICLMQDPVNALPAVLVKRYNITQQKHAELQLMLHEEALQRSALFPSVILKLFVGHPHFPQQHYAHAV